MPTCDSRSTVWTMLCQVECPFLYGVFTACLAILSDPAPIGLSAQLTTSIPVVGKFHLEPRCEVRTHLVQVSIEVKIRFKDLDSGRKSRRPARLLRCCARAGAGKPTVTENVQAPAGFPSQCPPVYQNVPRSSLRFTAAPLGVCPTRLRKGTRGADHRA
ncbi:hypothetical protein OH77DRAFT_1430364 [Trametes cingulata]|nr:hypothetical protein OH77DRAFT_1430364 [Trametes cingulata]